MRRPLLLPLHTGLCGEIRTTWVRVRFGMLLFRGRPRFLVPVLQIPATPTSEEPRE